MVSLPTLHELGGLPKFNQWRRYQEDAILISMDSPSRFVALCMQTGLGKSSVAIGRAVLSGARTIYLCSSKGQQDQITEDFASMGLVDVRGQDNYKCTNTVEFGIGSDLPVSAAPCHAGVVCPIKESSCTYYSAVRAAKQSRLVVTNYAYWILQNQFGDGLGNFDLMVCDEAHEAVQDVCSVLSTTLQKFEVEAILDASFPAVNGGVEIWKQWASVLTRRLEEGIEELRVEIREYIQAGELGIAQKQGKMLRERKDLLRRMEVLASLKGEWVAEYKGQTMVFDPVWPQEYAEGLLFRNIPKVVLMSATLRPKTLELLGIGEGEYEFVEFPAILPKERRPVYRVPTVRLNKNTDAEGYRTWVTRIDQIIRHRLHLKGIIHTVSYQRAKMLMEQSEYREYMISHTSSTTKSVVEAFKRHPAPLILVSPSMDTGWDFKDDYCRWMIIGKLPWPDTRAAVMAARKLKDEEYMGYLTAQSFVQMAGRGMRSEKDWCEVFVVDDSMGWFVKQHPEFMPVWFRESIKWVQTIPEPLEF